MKKRKSLPPNPEIPKIGSAPQERAEAKINIPIKKLSRWYKIYLTTTVSVVALTLVLLTIGLKDSNSFSLPTMEDIASFFISKEFRDISGERPEYITGDTGDFPSNIFDIMNGIMIPSKDPSDSNSIIVPDKDDVSQDNVDSGSSDHQNGIYDFDYSKIPEGDIAVVPMDLSLSSYGASYIYNSTGYSPDPAALMASKLSFKDDLLYISQATKPTVLILHTHATESYLPDGAISYKETSSEIARSSDISQNVVAVGATMAKILNENGISTLHCTLLHDQLQYKDSYARAEETIKQYLARYPSIKLVIDLHRDAVIKSTGDIVRPVALVDSQPTAQVMCVVGSDWGGNECKNWEGNLSLALQLRQRLNSKYGNLCRPTYLRSSTYNQELAPYSLLLEIGACGNSLKEANRAAALVAQELISIINGT